MFHKIFSVIFILSIIAITIIGYNTNTDVKKISLRNQNFELHNENPNIKNSNVDIKSDKTNLKNSNIKSKNSNITASNTNINISNSSSKIKTENIKNTNKSISNEKLKEKARYYYNNINWNEWKSNFINQILDDTSEISSLDNYGLGSWFYYSFDVMSDGSIKNIKIYSFYLNINDRRALENLIKSYEYQEITVFPRNSKRKKAKIDAVVILSESESKADPNDFHDYERVKIKY